MSTPRRRTLVAWLDLLTTSGLAALISGALGYFGVTATQSRERDTQRCQLAAQFLQDETPSPYIEVRTRQQLVARAARTLQQCLEDR